MSAIKSFFTMIDIFGVNYNFRYKDKEKYQTALGGFIVILFAILAITMAIYYFIPFVNRKNYTIVYYTMNLAKTEEVDLFASESNFAVGLICEKNKNEKKKIDELLDLDMLNMSKAEMVTMLRILKILIYIYAPMMISIINMMLNLII